MKKLFFLISLIIPFLGLAQNNLIPDTENCSSAGAEFAFTIRNAWNSNTGKKLDARHVPIIGDIDGDGNVEVFAADGYAGDGGNLFVFGGKTGKKIGVIKCPGIAKESANYTNGTAIFRRGSTGNGSVFIAGYNNVIYLYEVSYRDSDTIIFTKVWERSLAVSKTVPMAADLDGDGKIEIVTGQYIIDADTGTTLATLPYKGLALTFGVSFPLIAELDTDGHPEVIVGTHVYKYSAGTLSFWTCMPGFTQASGQDGCNIAADINQDGVMDLVYQSPGSGSGYIRVWTPSTGQNLGDVATSLPGHARSYHFVGDIDGAVEVDGKKYPEICVNTVGVLYAYKYNGSTFSQKWSMNHSDVSGGTALTLFDFNNDGVVELVYRDQTHLHIFDGSGNAPVPATTAIACGSATIVETPVVADVTGDGSANIIVMGDPAGTNNAVYGEVMVFEGKDSKWASCPNVWNQNLYSPLLINTDLTVPTTVLPANVTFTRPDASKVQFYNGGPMQAPYVSSSTYLPIDLAPDIFIVSGTLTILSNTSIRLDIVYSNQGKAVAAANMPIQYYQNFIATANVIDTDVLGVDLYPGQTHTISKVITGLSNPMPTQFYVRVMDDGSGTFPPAGAWSDCNLTNNTKSFGTIELFKTVNSQNACVDGTSIFTIRLINNTDITSSPVTYTNIVLTDSLGSGWNFVSASPVNGTVGNYSNATRKIEWKVPSLAPGATAILLITAKSTTAGSIRNTVWIEEINGTVLGREAIEAYVIVAAEQAPAAATISPANPAICASGYVTLTASVAGATSYQWYKDNVEISGATSQSYNATLAGNYTVTYYNGTCVSQMSNAVTVYVNSHATISQLTVPILNTTICSGSTATFTASSIGVFNPVYKWYTSQTDLTAFHIGASYTTPALTSATSYYVSVLGDNYCENEVNNRCQVTVSIQPNASATNIVVADATICSGETAILTATAPLVTSPVFNWYSSQTAITPIYTGASYNVAPTVITTYYVGVLGTNYCENATGTRQELTVTVNTLPATPTTASANNVCLNQTAAISISGSGNGTTYNVYTVATGGTPVTSGTGNGGTINISLGAMITTGTKPYYIEAVNTNACASSSRQTVSFEVNALPSLPLTDDVSAPSVCLTDNVNISIANSVSGNTYKVYTAATGGAAIITASGNGGTISLNVGALSSSPSNYYIEVENSNNCTSGSRLQVTVTALSGVIPGVIASSVTKVCYNNSPGTLTSISLPTGGDGAYSYQWQRSADGITWLNIGEATGTTYTVPVLTETAYFRRQEISSCGTVTSNVIKIDIQESVYVYPDIRIRACSQNTINLTKYVDSVDFGTIVWTPAASFNNGGNNDGTLVDATLLSPDQTYVYKYSVTNTCTTAGGTLYLTVVKNNNVTINTAEVTICKDLASSIQLNHIFGIETEGTWTCTPVKANDYLTIRTTVPFTGAAIFDGLSAWGDVAIPFTGANKEIEVIFTPNAGSCLSGETYKVKIILTEDITN
ncbi:MAG: hypothetical protein LBL90_02345 [Prevotellaceae bacterium]|jgi:uncharacterized repeat protein (TIGR01451 family)|nr:hypothetical protein [Prevotellaceae bacterium]